jgi:hypothetical protein
MNEIRWRMEHVLEFTPSWMLDSTPEHLQVELQARSLGLLSKIPADSGCVVNVFEVRPRWSLSQSGQKQFNEFRMRIIFHAEPKGRSGVDFERIAARLCADIDNLKKELGQ